MIYSTEPRHKTYSKGFKFLSFAKHISRKLGQMFLDTTKKSVVETKVSWQVSWPLRMIQRQKSKKQPKQQWYDSK